MIEDLRYDNYRWYCSKTTWWLYKYMVLDMGNNALIYFKGDPKVSGMCIPCKTILEMLGSPDAEQTALNSLYFTEDMVVWPDEIRYALAEIPQPLTGPRQRASGAAPRACSRGRRAR